MTRTRIKPVALSLALLLMLSPGLRIGQAQQQGTPLRYIVNGENALIFNRPELVCGGEVKQMQWSSDGRFAFAVRDATPPTDLNHPAEASTASVAVWNNEIRRARIVWSQAFRQWDVQRIQEGINWLPNTDVCLLPLAGTDAKGAFATRLLMLLPLRDTVREIPTGEHIAVRSNPIQPIALIEDFEAGPKNSAEFSKSHFRILRADGTFQDAQDYPQKEMILNQWSSDGKQFYAFAYSRDAKNKLTYTHYALDAATGTWTLLQGKPGPPAAPPEPPKSDLHIVRGTAVITQDGVKRTVHPAWIATDAKTGPPRALIAADCEEAILSPKGDAVLYRTQEGAFVLPLTKVPALAFAQMLRVVAMSNAKQVGLGLMMYVQDYDEQFPLADFNIPDSVGPYVKNSDLFEGFTYAYPGKGMANIAKPAETIMGTVAGPGGDAVIYADGHVKWRDKK